MSLSLDNKTIYEIFRACRLCGAGGGYKMPIIPSVVGFDCADIDLRQKINECVQIEVNQDDKMPPLICEQCVDKVNDFYEFLTMCRNTNVKTRRRLGLPDSLTQNSSESDNCILGVTEPVYQEDDDVPLRRPSRPRVKKEDQGERRKDASKGLKKELEGLIKQENVSREFRSGRSEAGPRGSRGRRSPSPRAPQRETRQTVDHSRLKVIDLADDDDDSALIHLGKRTRDSSREEIASKKLKITIKVPPPEQQPPPPKTKPRPGPKCSKEAPTSNPSKSNSIPAPKSSKISFKTPQSPLPGPKSSKRIQTPPPGPKSTKRIPNSPSTSPPTKSFRKPSPPPEPIISRKTSTAGQRPPEPKSTKSKNLPIIDSKTKPGPKSSKRQPSPTASPKSKLRGKSPVGIKSGEGRGGDHVCGVCGSVFQAAQGFGSHMRSAHTVRFTLNSLACNPCGEWFSTAEETLAHHKQHKSRHRPYACRGCGGSYHRLQTYQQHASESGCVPWRELPDVKCPECWRLFPTRVLLASHRCGGEDARPGGKCSKCKRTYVTLKSLKKHESSCTTKQKVPVPPAVQRRLRPARVLTAKCDQLLRPDSRGIYHVGGLHKDFGLDPNCVYPYRSFVRVKQEPLSFDGMVSIDKDVKDELYVEEDYVHWDSDNSSSDEEYSVVNPTEKKKKVPSLTTLTLKTIYSKRCLGKVPRKLRKVKADRFDAFLNPEGDFDNVQSDIDKLIDNLGVDNGGSEVLCGFSLNDIKLSDVKSISEVDNISGKDNEMNDDSDSLLEKGYNVVDKANDELDSLYNKDVDGVNSANGDSDSLLEKDEDIANDNNIEPCKNDSDDQTSLNIINKHLTKPALDNGSETDASLDDNFESSVNKDVDDKDTTSEISLNVEPQSTKENVDENEMVSESNLDNANKIPNNTENLQNGSNLNIDNRIENNCAETENPRDLMNELDELYDKNLLDDFSAQLNSKDTTVSDKNAQLLLGDFAPNKDVNLSMDNISDEDFNFDA